MKNYASEPPSRPFAVEHPTVDRGRTLVVWCPDWPVVAGTRQAARSSTVPAAVFRANRVQTCNQAARAEGITVGLRRRDAQSRCPELLVLIADPDRDARLFEPIAAAVESLAPAVEILRPGLLACSARSPTRYFGSETSAAERIVDLVEALDVECRVGVADSLPVAVLAARHAELVPPGGSAIFCADLPIGELARDPAIAPDERAQLVNLLIRLGITTAGSFAALPEASVATRFGADGLMTHRLARGLAERGISRRTIPEKLAVEKICDPPLERVDTAAFMARALAEQFHARLANAGMACTRLAISAATDRGQSLSRIWRCARPLTPAATADRLRWQLDGWLTAGRTLSKDATGTPVDNGHGPGAIIRLRLDPVEAIGAGLIQYGLWGSDGEDDQRAGWAFARVQGLLGPESVLAPVLSGGRGPADRITLVPWGEEKIPARDPSAPWPGAIPAPSPAVLPAPQSVQILDDWGDMVTVDGRGLLSSPPDKLVRGPGASDLIVGWAGPWLLDERWWAADRASVNDRAPFITSRSTKPAGKMHRAAGRSLGYHPAPGDLDYVKPPRQMATPDPAAGWSSMTAVSTPARYLARLQVLTETTALLLRFGAQGWELEGIYD